MAAPDISETERPDIDGAFVDAVDQFLEELSQRVNRDSQQTRSQYYNWLLDRLVVIASAERANLLLLGPDQMPVVALEKKASDFLAKSVAPQVLSFDQFSAVCNSDNSIEIAGRSGSTLGCSIEPGSGESAVITLGYSQPLQSTQRQLFAQLLTAVCREAEDFENRQLAANQDQRQQQLELLLQLTRNSHGSLDVRQAAFHIVNDSRHFLAADRVWLFAIQPATRLLACSSTSDVHKRSLVLRKLQRIVLQSIRKNEDIVWSLETPDSAPTDLKLQRLFNEYLESGSIKSFQLVRLGNRARGRPNNFNSRTGASPGSGSRVHAAGAHAQKAVTTSGRPFAVLVVETDDEADKLSQAARLNALVPCIEPAIANSLEHSRTPFRRTLNGVRWLGDRFRLGALPSTLATLVATAALAWLIFAARFDFVIDVHGELVPAVRRHVFAPADATVAELSVEYEQQVGAGDRLARLVSEQYELELKRLQGELDAAQKQLESNRLLRGQASRDGRDEIFLGQLTAEIEQYSLQIRQLNREISTYLELTGKLDIEAPVSGQVITRDLQTSLLNRPVRAGDRILAIADTSSDWKIEFRIPDRAFGYLQQVKNSGEVDEWSVEFRLSSDIERTFQTKIDRHETNNVVDEEGATFVLATAQLDKTQVPTPRVGQSVRGKVHCGQRSLFFIWTRDVRDFIRANFFWW